MAKLNNITYIEKARLVHGNLYDYSETDFMNRKEHKNQVYIKHPTLGGFWVDAYKHLYGLGLGSKVQYHYQKKYIKKDRSPKIFQEWLRKKYGDYYDFSKSVYVDSKTPIIVICPIHGEFQSNIYNLKCQKCQQEKNTHNYKYNTQKIKEKILSLYGNKFLLDKVEYNGDYDNAKITLICAKDKHEITHTLRSILKGKCQCNVCVHERKEKAKQLDLIHKKEKRKKKKFI